MTKFNRRHLMLGGLGLAASASLSRSALAAEDPVRLTYVLTNDLYKINEENGRGGLARLASVLKQERSSGNTTLFTHAGDALSPSLLSGFDQGASMLDLLNMVHPDIFVPGNHEFDFGKAIFLQRMSEAQFPLMAANLRMPDGERVPAFADQMLIEVVGIKIGMSGATLDDTPKLSSPGDLIISDTVHTLVEQAKNLRAAGADLTVAIVHADKPTIRRLAGTRAYDIIISGHNHDLAIDYDGRTLTAESGEDAHQIVCIDLIMAIKQTRDKRSLSWWPNIRVIDSASQLPNADVLSKIKTYETRLASTLDLEVATLNVDLDSREASVRAGETVIGDLIADALKQATKADVALTNGGGIRGDKLYPAGTKLTRRDILTELPFGNRTVVTGITGKALRAALENGLSQAEQMAGRFPQVSGMKIIASRAASPGARVQSIEINGLALDDTKIYRLATNDFLVKGGDGYTSLASAAASPDTGDRLMANDVMDYLATLGTISAKTENRLIFK